MNDLPFFTDDDILAARPARNAVDPSRPYEFLVEPEHTAAGTVEDVATIFLTNRECPFRCLMCDLWKNTTTTRVAEGAIPGQIDYALARLPSAEHVKLYNSGNFFDGQAIRTADHRAIAERVGRFKTVIVENHPKLCNNECVRFRDRIDGELEVAIGLETVHPEVLSRLNKQMTLDDFDQAVRFLRKHEIHVRAFILLRPPFLSEQEGIEWALRSLEFAFSLGVRCCTIIPVRGGNGVMDQLQSQGLFAPPAISSLETVFTAGLKLNGGRVFADLWDAERLEGCARCRTSRLERMQQMNLSQQVSPPIRCECEARR